MKLKRENNRRKTGKGRIAAVLVLAVLLGAAPAIKTQAVDLTSDYTVNVSGDTTSYTGLGDAKVVLDVYKVADANPIDGQDAYTFGFKAPFTTTDVKSALDDLQKASESGGTGVTAEQIDSFAQLLAGIALDPDNASAVSPETVTEWTDNSGIVTASFTEKGGLYLIIPHGSDLTNYVLTASESKDPKYVATIAKGKTKQYVFAPILVPIPNRGLQLFKQEMTIAGEDEWTYQVGAGNTAASAGVWDDPASPINLTLKVGEKEMYGSFELVKELERLETVTFKDRADTATFVFSIEGKLNGEVVYSNVESMVFDASGSQSKVVNHIPVGAEVTVTEVYKGGNYKIKDGTSDSVTVTIVQPDTGDEATDATIREENDQIASFVNDYERNWKGGGSVRNHFDSDDEGIHWSDEGSTKTYSNGTTEPLSGQKTE